MQLSKNREIHIQLISLWSSKGGAGERWGKGEKRSRSEVKRRGKGQGREGEAGGPAGCWGMACWLTSASQWKSCAHLCCWPLASLLERVVGCVRVSAVTTTNTGHGSFLGKKCPQLLWGGHINLLSGWLPADIPAPVLRLLEYERQRREVVSRSSGRFYLVMATPQPK